jgi:hypothetical protein
MEFLLAELTSNDWAVIIGAIGLMLGQLLTLGFQLFESFNNKHARVIQRAELEGIKMTTEEQHKVMNSRLDEYKRIFGESELARGIVQGRREFEAEHNAKVAAVVAAGTVPHAPIPASTPLEELKSATSEQLAKESQEIQQKVVDESEAMQKKLEE